MTVSANNFKKVPDVIVTKIINFLPDQTSATAARVCTQFRSANLANLMLRMQQAFLPHTGAFNTRVTHRTIQIRQAPEEAKALIKRD